jgi:hypothetical protein
LSVSLSLGRVVFAPAENYLGHLHAEQDEAVTYGHWSAWARFCLPFLFMMQMMLGTSALM